MVKFHKISSEIYSEISWNFMWNFWGILAKVKFLNKHVRTLWKKISKNRSTNCGMGGGGGGGFLPQKIISLLGISLKCKNNNRYVLKKCTIFNSGGRSDHKSDSFICIIKVFFLGWRYLFSDWNFVKFCEILWNFSSEISWNLLPFEKSWNFGTLPRGP